MAVNATVTRGFTFSDTTPITPSNLNSLGAPTVDIAGAVGSLSLSDGSVTNTKVNASAAIDYSKLAALTSGNLLVGSGANVATSVAMSGDGTLSSAGALTIAAGAVEATMLAADAVTTAKITDVNVTTAKIADDAVTADKLANTAVTAGSYTTADITVDAQGRVTSASDGSADNTLGFASAQGVMESSPIGSGVLIGTCTLTLPSGKTWKWVKVSYSSWLTDSSSGGESHGATVIKDSSDADFSFVKIAVLSNSYNNSPSSFHASSFEGVPTSHTTDASLVLKIYGQCGVTPSAFEGYAVGQYS